MAFYVYQKKKKNGVLLFIGCRSHIIDHAAIYSSSNLGPVWMEGGRRKSGVGGGRRRSRVKLVENLLIFCQIYYTLLYFLSIQTDH